jgi:hypothetical protein
MGEQGFGGVNSSNVKAMMEERCNYYEGAVESLRDLIETEGVSIENLSQRRRSLLQGLAVDIGRDLSVVTRIKIQCAGSSYYQSMLDPFCWYLKDLISSLRLFEGSERGHLV